MTNINQHADALKWWRHLNQEQRAKVWREWLNSPGGKKPHFAADFRMVEFSSSTIELIYKHHFFKIKTNDKATTKGN